MGEIKKPLPVLRFAAISSREPSLLDWARQQMVASWGALAGQSPVFEFEQTRFYQRQMGDQLLKQFVAFEPPIDPSEIVDSKIQSNQWEQQAAAEYGPQMQVERPVNIDPGYVTEAKLVLATTKDRDHRIYLDRGILAEVTLFYQNHQWNASRWTYPDYQTESCRNLLDQCRRLLRNEIHGPPVSGGD